MHLPALVFIFGFVGLLLHCFTYWVIGGYTILQDSFFHVTVNTEEKALPMEKNSKNDEHLKKDLKSELGDVHYRTRREGVTEFLRDICSTIFVIVCAIIVYFAKDKEHTAIFIDPVLSIFSCVLVVCISYPYMKEACQILLQTIPTNIHMGNFEGALVKKFPQIESYHDLHIWQLTSQRYIATIHIIFKNSKMYTEIIEEVRSFFGNHNIGHVTIQPEFYDEKNKSSSVQCLLPCARLECLDKICCKDTSTTLNDVSVCSAAAGEAKPEQVQNKRKCDKNENHANHHVEGPNRSQTDGYDHKTAYGQYLPDSSA